MLAWRTIRLRDDRLVLVRAAEPADAERLQAFVRGLPVQTRVKRFFAPIRELSARELERLVAPAGAHDLHLLAGNWEMLGLAAKLGFELESDADPELVRLELPLGLEAAAYTRSAWTARAPRHGNQFSKEMHA